MPPSVIKYCILTLILVVLVYARRDGLSGFRHAKDVFERRDIDSLNHLTKRDTAEEIYIPVNSHRTKRSDPSSVDLTDKTCPADPSLSKGKTIVNDEFIFTNESRLSISMSWVGSDFKTILLLATSEMLIFATQRSALYKSSDFGKTFKQINTDIFNAHIRRNFGIQKSPVDPNRVILVSYSLPIFGKFSTLYVTMDGANSWKSFQAPFQISGAIEFHPRNNNWILARSNLLSQGAFLSTNFGRSWTRLRSYVMSAKWGARHEFKVEKEESSILLTVAPVENGQPNIYDLELWRSRNLGRRFQLLVKHCYTFGIQGPFLFVSVDLNKNNRTRIMHVSTDGGDTFDKAGVPSIFPEQFYSILDMSEGMVFLHVDSPQDTGKGALYTSDADGIVFDKSLENHVYTNFDAATDFYKVESMNGTYITSIMNADNSISTVITFDRGGEWKPIPLDQNKLCKGIKFNKDQSCSLHIHYRFSLSRGVPGMVQGPLSESNAPGIIIAHANPGAALMAANIGIWVSRNGGYDWKQALKGPHYYSIADHGKLIVAVPATASGTSDLMYSVDEGACWYRYQFTETNLVFTGLVTAPGARTLRFSIWGYTLPNKTWRVITVDFEKLLTFKCLNSDYESWVPHGSGKNEGCLLGRKVTFRRAKPDSLCYNGEDFVGMTAMDHCSCTMADLECEYGFYRKVGESECKKDPTKKPKLCIGGEQEDITDRGYRRIPGDVCEGGLPDKAKYLDAHKRCFNSSYYYYGMEKMQNDRPKPQGHKTNVTAAVVVPIMLIALGICVYFGKKFWDVKKFKPGYQYSSIPTEANQGHQNEEEDDMFDPRPKGLQPYHDSDDDAPMIDV
ncbi:sortilin [Nematostella vectensis]|uniref:sortilin n=1 Tax=Nematostella vectensis TaxID=45351 RepID=UPI001390427C|nr:sortilin [Nematostella vectensis]